MFGIFRENSNIQKVLQQNYQVVFYAENAYYFQYFRHLFDSLIRHQVKICYISSDANDPVLRLESPFVDTVYSKSTLAFLFSRLRADVMILTMPDLDRYI